MSSVTLRPYQIEAIEAAEKYWVENPLKNAAVSLPTGSGKTVIFSEIARRAVERGERVAIIVDRDELVNQTVAKLHDADPMMFVGIVKASKNVVGADVVVCSIQTLRRPGRAEQIPPRGVVLYDEAHGSASDSAVDVMRRLGTIGGPAKAVGFSATFYRADNKPLDVIWDDIVYEKSILWAVNEGYLADARGITVPIEGLDLGNVKMSGGDFQDRDLGQQMLDAHAAEQIADAYLGHAAGRITICFAPTIAAAEAITEQMVARGVAAECVTGKTPAGERAKMYARLEAGETRVLTSVAVLTTGFDSPRVDCVLMARPTQSQGLYVQCIGRGLRLHPEKDHCLILDVSSSSDMNSLVGMPNLAGKDKKETGSLKEMAGGMAPDRGPQGLRANLRNKGEFDPFARKKLAWNKTYKGIEFVAVKEGKRGGFVFLQPAGEDLVRVGKVEADKGRDGKPVGSWIQEVPILKEFAMPLAEVYAESIGVHSTKSGIKKRNNTTGSVGMIGFASQLGIENAHDIGAGTLSMLIDKAKASEVLD